jgi:8-amino-7-oxononanoate synthase
MSSLEIFAKHKLEKAARAKQARQLYISAREDGVYVNRGGRKLISFSCNDYLGLSNHPLVKKAAIDAIEKYGTCGGASRLVTGNNPLYNELETLLATIKNTESALVFGSGYLANIGIIPALVGRGDLIIADKLVHASLIDGCKLSGAKLLRFTHNNIQSCENILKKQRTDYKNCLIVTDNIFSMDGDAAPIDALYDLAEQHNGWLMSDDAHGLGTISNINRKIPHIQMGTFSKAVGSYGGYVCAQKTVIDYLVGSAKSLVYSTSLPPATLAASIAALKIITENKDLCAKPLQNAKLFTKLLGLPDAISPIVPIITNTEDKAILAAQNLKKNGFLVSAIRPPTVPIGTSRLRFTFSALHNTKDIEKLAEIINGLSIL